MEKQTFYSHCQSQLELLKAAELRAIEIHQQVNQTYGAHLCYGYHLEMTAYYVRRFGYLVAQTAEDVVLLFTAAYFHDSIEDARLTYNNVFEEFCALGMSDALARRTADVVYALTNLRGKTRAERANEAYYQLIRETPFAPFLKMCDRLANATYSTRFGATDRMAIIYKNELSHFLESIAGTSQPSGSALSVPTPMIEELEDLLG